MNRLAIVLSWIFGGLLLGLSGLVAAETVARKLFNFSFQGADELGGYVLAVGGALGFTVALIERAHIRIDLLHHRFGRRTQACLNLGSSLVLAALGVFLARYGWLVIRDTLEYQSTAPTAWATPMIYPQAIWYACLLSFTVASLWLAWRALRRLLRGELDTLNREFHPKGALDELEEELQDLRRR